MKHTLEYILLTQSPALFLFAVALLFYFLFQRKTKKFLSALALIAAIIALVGGIAFYYLGMLNEHFTIHDFWQIRLPGWIGLGLAAAVVVLILYRSTVKAIQIRRAKKQALRAEQQRVRELEEAKQAAYDAGHADALAEETVIGTVSEAVAASPAPAEENTTPTL